jgi:DNA-binding transcriptional ArsR family regulator
VASPVIEHAQSKIRCDEDEVYSVVAIFKALSDPTRLRIIIALDQEKNICVSDIAQRLDMSVSRVSHHLGILEKLGFTRHKQDGKQVYHTIDDNCILDILARAQEHVRGN